MGADADSTLRSAESETPAPKTGPSDGLSGGDAHDTHDAGNERPAKRLRLEASASSAPDAATNAAADAAAAPAANGADDIAMTDAPASGPASRIKGLAPIKAEYLIEKPTRLEDAGPAFDDDAAESRGHEEPESDRRDDRRNNRRDRHGAKHDRRDRKKEKGQNKDRQFGQVDDTFRLCQSRTFAPEFSPLECRFGDECKNCHDLRKYLAEGRRDDSGTETFRGGPCPVFETFGRCYSGWKCRFVKTHMKEVEHPDGRKELVLLEKEPWTSGRVVDKAEAGSEGTDKADEGEPETSQKPEKEDPIDARPDIVNVISSADKTLLSRKKVEYARADEYIKWMNSEAELHDTFHTKRRMQETGGIDDLRARYIDPPFLPSEKRRLYFGPETPVLAPLTTQGNVPFRRLCVELGAQLTYSEMAMSMHLLQGNKTDWTLLRAHKSEVEPPRISDTAELPSGYDWSRDLRFGAQISASTPWSAVKAADTLSRYCPHLRLIDLNCGCPIDTIFKSGGGSALLDTPNKMERMIRGMNAVSGDLPITVKIRTGVRSSRPNATAVIGKLAFGSREHRSGLGAPGCAAITLHGRSREMRYTKQADWSYIAECSALIKSYNEQRASLCDTAAEPDARTQAAAGKIFFLGNGDCYSHVDYARHVADARVDAVMVGRGALVKPWLFEEIEKGQYLDKTSSQRLEYVEKFVRYGLEAWGSDEVGVTFTRRFLLEWLSFAHRYVPIGLLEHLPPSLNDRPPPFKGRDEMETLLASPNYRDWIKISEMYLGPVHPGFQFQPKHKSHAYEAEG